MNIEGNTNFASLPNELVLKILTDTDPNGYLDPKYQLICKKFQEVFIKLGYDYILQTLENPLSSDFVKQIEQEHPLFSNVEKTNEIYKAVIETTCNMEGKKIYKELLANEAISPQQKLMELACLYQFFQSYNLIKLYDELPIESKKRLVSLAGAEMQDPKIVCKMMKEADEIRKWMEENTHEIEQIEYLNLSNLDLTALPKEIGKFTGLRTLNLSDNKLVALPPEIVNLSQLETINLNFNKLDNLPPEIGNLSKLEHLEICFNRLIKIPSEIGKLTTLNYLSLNSNLLSTLPKEIVNLTNIHTLKLDENRLEALPSEIGSLINLIALSLQRNCLKAFPQEIGELTELMHLDAGSNQLESLPPEIGKLAKLEFLNFNNNRLTTLPSELEKLDKNLLLCITGNPIESLPEEIRKFKRIKK